MLTENSQKPLRDDVRLLGMLLGETLIGQEGEDLYRRVERVRGFAKRARLARERSESSERAIASEEEAFRELAAELGAMPLDAAVPVARAFSQFLHLANVAEQ